MSTGHPINPTPPAGTDFSVGPAGDAPTSPPPDAELIQETKNQIRTLVNEIARLAKSDRSEDDFYDEFLRRVSAALASSGGAVWTVNQEGRQAGGFDLKYQINFSSTGLTDQAARLRHALLLQKTAEEGPMLVPPQSGSTGEAEAGNTTEFLLVLAPVILEDEVRAVVEIFQRPGAGPTTQRGYLRFLVQMCDLAADFLKNRRLRHFNDRQIQWMRLEDLVGAVHQSLDVRETAYAIANEGKRFIECDRVSVAIRRGARCRVEAVSGLDAIDRRAAEVASLERLAAAVLATEEPLWRADDGAELPPQIERPLEQYRDRAHARSLAVLPLCRLSEEDGRGKRDKRIVGALVVEQLASDRLDETVRHRTETIVRYSAPALANALEHEAVPLRPVWRALGRATAVFHLHNLPKTLLAATAVLALIGVLAAVPAELKLAAQGKLQPSVRRQVFAKSNGVVIEAPVRHGQRVAPGDVLVRMRNTDLEVAMSDLDGRLRTTRERIETVGRALLDGRRMSAEQQNRLDGELLELNQSAESLERQLELYRQKQQTLVLRAEEHGQVVTWRVGETLLRRPVQQGQALMSIVDPDSEWELELNVPERRLGHVAAAAQNPSDALRVTFMMRAYPDRQFEGKVIEMHRTASVHGDEGAVVTVRVAIDKNELPELRSQTTVSARIHCGTKPLGYVVFHDLIETIQAKVLFWIS